MLSSVRRIGSPEMGAATALQYESASLVRQEVLPVARAVLSAVALRAVLAAVAFRAWQPRAAAAVGVWVNRQGGHRFPPCHRVGARHADPSHLTDSDGPSIRSEERNVFNAAVHLRRPPASVPIYLLAGKALISSLVGRARGQLKSEAPHASLNAIGESPA